MTTETIGRIRQGVALLLISFVVACSSGGGDSGFSGSSPPPPPPPPAGGSDWTEGVFLDAATFADRCENPRNGTNPATNAPYPDIQGSILDENNFLRSYSDDTYLWYSEITDQDPGLFNDPLVYFDQLRTFATTPSGQAKDKFHFTIPTEEFFQASQGGVTSGYGITWRVIESTPPREVVIALTEPNSPATNLPAPLARGARVLAIDGVDMIDGNDVDTLNAGLFPETVGETHTFEILDLGAQTSRTIQLTSATITTAPVQNVGFIDTPTGRVGYMLFNDHNLPAEDGLIDAINQLNTFGVDDLVLDLRYNGGGFLFIASQLAYMIGGPQSTGGQTFETLQFNDKHPATDPVTGEALEPTPFYSTTTGGDPLPVLNLVNRRVFVLTGGGTCSASESVINGLRGVDIDVYQFGSTTCGKPYGFYPTDNCGTTYFTIQFRGANAKDFGDYSDGFTPANDTGPVGTIVPGCSVADDFNAQLGDAAEARLAAALNYRETQACPSPTGTSGSEFSKPGATRAVSDDLAIRTVDHPMRENRILGRP